MTKSYAIFVKEWDCEIHIELIEGNQSSIEYIKDDIREQLIAFPDSDSGYCEQYPFYMANWNIMGYDIDRFEKGFNFDQVLEL